MAWKVGEVPKSRFGVFDFEYLAVDRYKFSSSDSRLAEVLLFTSAELGGVLLHGLATKTSTHSLTTVLHHAVTSIGITIGITLNNFDDEDWYCLTSFIPFDALDSPSIVEQVGVVALLTSGLRSSLDNNGGPSVPTAVRG